MGLIDIAFAAFNCNKICYVYNIYSGINRSVNKKESAILKYFDVYNTLMFVICILPYPTTYKFFSNQLKAGLVGFENLNT